MPTKKYDIAIKLGTYTDRQGQEKGRWLNVGAVMQGDDGNFFALLHRHVNLGGIPNPDGRDSVLASLFPANRQQGQQQGHQPQQQEAQAPTDFDENIPF